MDPRLIGGPPGLAQDGPLEDRLRNMILGHNPQGAAQPGSQMEGNAASAHDSEAGASGHHAHADAKASRGKRPNQAQRRQMNAQLSIPIDTRPADQWYSRQQGQGYAPRGHRNDFHHADQGRQHPPSFAPHGSFHQGHQGQHQGRGQGHHNQQYGRGHYGMQGQFAGRGGPGGPRGRGRGGLYNHQGQAAQASRPEDFGAQVNLLNGLCETLVVDAEIEREEIAEKESFRIKIESICRQVITEHETRDHGRQDFIPDSMALKCFGSLASGFATKASDMDLGLISPLSEPQPYDADSEVPRLVEKAFLEHGYGARLLTNTRVPIIKVCEKPPPLLMHALVATRTKWENGTEDAPEVASPPLSPKALKSPQSPKAMKPPQSPKTTKPAPTPKTTRPAQSPKIASSSQSTEMATQENATGAREDAPEAAEAPRLSRKERARSLSRQRQQQVVDHLSNLKQASVEPLAAYHAAAKGILQKMGGSDITLSNYREFQLQDYELLLSMCRAFVDGLYDEALKTEVLSYPSMAPSPEHPGSQSQWPQWRTFHGVLVTVQGASMIQWYHASAAQHSRPEQESAVQNTIAEWMELQKKPDFGLDPLLYQKQLQHVHDKLSRTPSIQYHTLKQQRLETVNEYYQRAVQLVANLQPKDNVTPEEFSRYLVDQYAAGILSDELRWQVTEFVQNCPDPLTLVDVGRRHKSLRLAKDFEKAMNAYQYDPALKDDIEEYLSILNQPLIRVPSQPHYVVPQPDPRLLTIISQLKNPAKMAVNQASRGYNDALEFPKSGVGVQCDINFSAHLALQNTTLLRCYSHTDPRVRPLVLFIKHWAKRRGINTPYRGTLSSYGYVLMMIHYLVNVVQPFVCPNLQALGPQLPAPLDATGRLIPQFNPDGTPAHPPFDESVACRGRFVGFWRDEAAIQHLSATHQLNGNRDSIGHLLRGFFEYYAQNGYMTTYPTVNGFDWGREVISIRTPHGIVTKQRKGWTGAKTVIEVRGRASPDPGAPLPSPMDAIRSPTDANPIPAGKASVSTGGSGEIKEIRNRYLFAIEDPFELDHNVARTVTHKGIVSIRDEFRRAWRIIRATTADGPALSKHGIPEELLEDADVQTEKAEENTHEFAELLAEIHGLTASQ